MKNSNETLSGDRSLVPVLCPLRHTSVSEEQQRVRLGPSTPDSSDPDSWRKRRRSSGTGKHGSLNKRLPFSRAPLLSQTGLPVWRTLFTLSVTLLVCGCQYEGCVRSHPPCLHEGGLGWREGVPLFPLSCSISQWLSTTLVSAGSR